MIRSRVDQLSFLSAVFVMGHESWSVVLWDSSLLVSSISVFEHVISDDVDVNIPRGFSLEKTCLLIAEESGL